MVRKFFGPFIGFDGDGDGSGDGGDAGGNAGGTGTTTGGKTFTQQEFDSHMAQMRRKHEAELKKNQKELADQLAEAKKNKGLSDEERSALQKRIDDLEAQYLTDQQKAERKAAEERTTFTSQIEGLTGERDSWKRRFEQKAASSDIAEAASQNKAINAKQIRAILDPMIQFKEGTNEDGEPNGEFTAVVKFPDIDAKTKEPIVMEYTVAEAVKRMKELDEYSNLFEDTMKGGLGGGKNPGGSRKINAAELAKNNPAEYRRLRKENPAALYGSMGSK